MAVARDVMTPNPRIVDTDTTAQDVAQILADEDIGAVIVCGDVHAAVVRPW